VTGVSTVEVVTMGDIAPQPTARDAQTLGRGELKVDAAPGGNTFNFDLKSP
jgi:hypothetical protein